MKRWKKAVLAMVLGGAAAGVVWRMTAQKSLPASAPEQKEALTVALTFDDGPHPVYTERLLDGLKERGVLATFFVIGKNAEENPELVRRMAEEGHLVGNHTYHHVQLSQCSISGALEEVCSANELLEELTGDEVEYIRPPFGSWKGELSDAVNMTEVLWDIDPLDWKVQNSATVANHILMKVKNHQIILLHDVYESSVEAAFQVIDELRSRGYEFVTVEELVVD